MSDDALSLTVRDGVATISVTEFRKELSTVTDDVITHPRVDKVRVMRNGEAIGEYSAPDFEDDEDADRIDFGDDDGEDDGDEN